MDVPWPTAATIGKIKKITIIVLGDVSWIGAGLLGAGALGLNYARSVAKNRARKAQVNVT